MTDRSWRRLGVTVVLVAVWLCGSLSVVSAQRRRAAPLAAGCTGSPTTGCWDNLLLWPMQAIHAALVPTGTSPNIVWKVLVWDVGERSGSNTVVQARLWSRPGWDPGCTVQDGCFVDAPLTITNTIPNNYDTIFCAGHSFLGDGRLLVVGGGRLNVAASGPFITHIFNSTVIPPANPWTRVAPLTGNVCDPELPIDRCIGGRYYPSPLTHKDPFSAETHVLAMHGLNNRSIGTNNPPPPAGFIPNRSVEHYRPLSDAWTLRSPADIPINPLLGQYPWLHLLPRTPGDPNPPTTSTVLFSGHFDELGDESWRFAYKYDVRTAAWAQVGTVRTHKRVSGTPVLLPVTDPAAGGDGGRVLTVGGADGLDTGITNTADIFCVGPAPLHPTCGGTLEGWRTATSMSNPRQHAESVALPDGNVVVLGGESAGGCDPPGQEGVCPGQIPNVCVPVYDAELFRPPLAFTPQAWLTIPAPADPQRRPRQYHSVCLLLPDGSVLCAGGETDRRCFVNGSTAQIYRPGYFFAGVNRPVIASLPTQAAYDTEIVLMGESFGASPRVVLMRPGSVTHSVNFDQRYVELRVVASTPTSITFKTPSTWNVAPAGYYLLFVVQDSPQGPLPSKYGEFIRLTL